MSRVVSEDWRGFVEGLRFLFLDTCVVRGLEVFNGLRERDSGRAMASLTSFSLNFTLTAEVTDWSSETLSLLEMHYG
jgi:hypothetical protein